MSGKIRILLADDHIIVRMGIASAISFENDMTVVGEAGNGEDAVRLATELRPDVVVMDLMMPRMDGAKATSAILKDHPATGILILTSFITSADLGSAIRAGARGAVSTPCKMGWAMQKLCPPLLHRSAFTLAFVSYAV